MLSSQNIAIISDPLYSVCTLNRTVYSWKKNIEERERFIISGLPWICHQTANYSTHMNNYVGNVQTEIDSFAVKLVKKLRANCLLAWHIYIVCCCLAKLSFIEIIELFYLGISGDILNICTIWLSFSYRGLTFKTTVDIFITK